jgi:hypothetical protein
VRVEFYASADGATSRSHPSPYGSPLTLVGSSQTRWLIAVTVPLTGEIKSRTTFVGSISPPTHTSHELTVDWWQEHANHLAEGVLSMISDPWSQDRCAGAGLDPDVLLRVGASSDMRTMDTADYAAGPNSGAVKNDTEVTNFEPSHDRI